MAVLPQSPTISPSSIVTVTETFPHTVPRSLASRDANEVLTDPSSMDRLVDPLLRIGAQTYDIYPVVEVDLSPSQQHPQLNEREVHCEDKKSRRRRPSSNGKKVPKRRISDPTYEQDLATDAAMKLHHLLMPNFTGNDEDSKFILLARINLVSDGCCDDDAVDCGCAAGRTMGAAAGSIRGAAAAGSA